jgi:hypothetical protein
MITSALVAGHKIINLSIFYLLKLLLNVLGVKRGNEEEEEEDRGKEGGTLSHF